MTSALTTLALIASAGRLIGHLALLIVVVSLVYGATRHELMAPILQNSAKAAAWIFGFMAVIFVVLFLISWKL